jgi:uncharacterized protein (DUF2164 family)
MPIELSDDVNKRAIASLRRYCAEELELELGELPAQLFLGYLLEEIGPSIYNVGVADAAGFLRERVTDLEDACPHAEFAWSARQRRPSR